MPWHLIFHVYKYILLLFWVDLKTISINLLKLINLKSFSQMLYCNLNLYPIAISKSIFHIVFFHVYWRRDTVRTSWDLLCNLSNWKWILSFAFKFNAYKVNKYYNKFICTVANKQTVHLTLYFNANKSKLNRYH